MINEAVTSFAYSRVSEAESSCEPLDSHWRRNERIGFMHDKSLRLHLATSPAILRVTSISARAARAISPESLASVTNRNPIAIIRAA